jgi:hypothetical protein
MRRLTRHRPFRAPHLAAILLVVLAAMASLSAVAIAKSASYNGPAGSGPNAGVELTAKFKKGHAVSVTRFEFHNIPAACKGSGETAISDTYGARIKVNSHRKFSGTRTINGGKLTIKVSGRFKSDFSKVSGTLRVHGTVPGCKSAATGPVKWHAPRL